MLAPTLGNPPSVTPLPRVRARSVAIDGALLAVTLAVAAVLFFQGGLEALIGASLGTLLGFSNAPWRNARVSSAISGAFAGLFAGALFAGFFHGVIAAALSALL